MAPAGAAGRGEGLGLFDAAEGSSGIGRRHLWFSAAAAAAAAVVKEEEEEERRTLAARPDHGRGIRCDRARDRPHRKCGLVRPGPRIAPSSPLRCRPRPPTPSSRHCRPQRCLPGARVPQKTAPCPAPPPPPSTSSFSTAVAPSPRRGPLPSRPLDSPGPTPPSLSVCLSLCLWARRRTPGRPEVPLLRAPDPAHPAPTHHPHPASPPNPALILVGMKYKDPG